MKCKNCKQATEAHEVWMMPNEHWYYCNKHSPCIGYVLDGEMDCEDINYQIEDKNENRIN